MKPRKSKEISRVLSKKGFVENPARGHHHEFYVLIVDGIKTHINTYLSHGSKEYGAKLMGEIKKQLRFETAKQAEDFFDCPMSGQEYVNLLKNNGEL